MAIISKFLFVLMFAVSSSRSGNFRIQICSGDTFLVCLIEEYCFDIAIEYSEKNQE
jgi:hypothetical protein